MVEDQCYDTMSDYRTFQISRGEGRERAKVTTGGRVSAENQLTSHQLGTWGETYKVLLIPMRAVGSTQGLTTAVRLTNRISPHFLQPPPIGRDREHVLCISAN